MNSKRFIPLDIHPNMIEQPKTFVNDDVEEITDDDEEVEWKPKPIEIVEDITDDEEEVEWKQKPIVVVKKPQIIVIKKQQQPVVAIQNNTDPNIIPIELDNLIDDILEIYEIEKRRKQRQRIKRKKANKRRYQKMLWAKRYGYKK